MKVKVEQVAVLVHFMAR